MNDDFISQEEIDALLKGGIDNNDSASADTSSNSDVAERLSDIERDALGEIGNISMGSAATTLSVLLGHRVSITTPQVSIDTLASIKDHYPMPYLIVEVGYTHGIEGNNILAIQAQDALIIADLMMGGEGTAPPEELNELHMSAVGEAMNQMMGAVSTSLSTMFNKKIDISPPKVNLIDLAKEDKVTDLVGSEEKVVRVSFRMEVEGLIDSEIMQILPIDISKDMVSNLMSGSMEESAPEPAVTAPPVMQQPVQAPQEAYAAPPQQQPAAQQQTYATVPMQQQARVASNIPVQPAQFSPLSTEPVTVNDANIGLILDVPLQVTVELGRTKKRIRDILELANGSIIELDKLAGEPVDILVNGKLLAKGEVVVIDENFGVRITDIVSPMERAQNLQ
ncbi:flagellar motor switch protein FliN/FliY [Propionispira arboris]|uniref:Flagellar motor switch protein FliN/FliY n=1 Tax=Propionispira arboris TaxID=84035 RepID=A0A1H7AAY4_9FIRM|nr:flagellar motor switch phosphatase FliY [Propionispira arboris]SEJ62793.1 flagellar motor switch protein FliN/FliY [Propionispira arboris]